MTIFRRTLLAVTLVAPVLTLAACDGYEMQLYQGFPYANERTAGSGIAYVRVNLMPPKGPVLEQPAPAPIVVPPPAPVVEPVVEPITPADPIIEQKARK